MFRTISKAPTNPPPSQTFPLSQKTGTKITYDSTGKVLSSTHLQASDIPDLEISQITGLQDALDAAGDDWGSQVVEHDGTLDGDGTIGNPLTVLSAGSVDIIDITYADMATALSGATLTKGQFYRITDASGTDLGFITQAIREDEISVGGNGGYLNADFQAVGDYSGVLAETGVAPLTQLGIWRTGFESFTIDYINLAPNYITYTTSSGLLSDGETYLTDLGNTGTIIHDDGSTVTLIPDQLLIAGEIITGDISLNTVTIDTYVNPQFAVGDTITDTTTSAQALITAISGSTITCYQTLAGGFNTTETIDNGSGVTADIDALTTASILTGDIVIWNLIHYQCVDATVLDGTNPATNTSAYTELARTVADVGYVTEWDISEFDFGANQIEYRSDLRGNVIKGNIGTVYFQWGNDLWTLNVLQSGAYIQQPNLYCELRSCFIYSNGYIIESEATGPNVAIFGLVIFPGAGIQGCVFGEGTQVNTCELGTNSVLSYVTTGSNCTIENNILENGASMTGITAGANCSISRNTIGQGATMGGSTTMGDGAEMNDLEIRANKQLSNKTLDAGVTFSDKILEITIDGTEAITANIEGNKAQPGFSDIPKTFDITSLTTLDWLAENNYVGIGNITSSNATEAIDQIDNSPTAFPFLLRPAAGLTLTVTGTAISGIGAGQIALTTADVVLVGDNGEWLELEADPGGGGFLREKNRSGTIL